MKLLLLGSNGQLGQALLQQLHQPQQSQQERPQFQSLALSHTQLDITDSAALAAQMAAYRPDIVLNCAAWTNVDKAEQQSDSCFAVNAMAAGQLATLCQQHNSLLVQFSTDYVFDGTNNMPYTERHSTTPLNVYGRSKLAAEQLIQANCSKYLILRSSWLFSEYGHNFYRTMLRLAQQQLKLAEPLSVVNDQFGCPTYAGDLAAIVLQLLQRYQQQGSVAYGLYHLAGQPAVSWYQFAQAIFAVQQVPVSVMPLSSAQYAGAATRPANSALDCSKFCDTFGIVLPQWQAALNQLKQVII
ncbi:dTDP-4-dehydrorhamnose reductase [Rheinheimera sp.]|uniref:dTDP-4-dehydrorhamnose reductase n=1 Tax=Rheinheimera sp. TaxID=1869214 RepID=UPI002732887C|nr:dTDP-4-dehydrorhamnose reductase [Rheinheimera sp.]MDP2715665.1 dTDP-4-dehydrorhamnose reductase [Rheinheimera sp.]